MPRLDKAKDREYQKLWVKQNPEKIKAYSKKWREINNEKQRELNRKWRLEHPEYRKKYYQTHKLIELKQASNYQRAKPEKQKIYRQRYVLKNKDKIRNKRLLEYTPKARKTRYEKNKEYFLMIGKIRRNRIHSTLIWHYSRGTYKCACCGFGDGRLFLELDHINGFGNKHRNAIGQGNFHLSILRSNLPNAYQVLCCNCNRAKFRNGGICPHKETPLLPVHAQEN